ncbi:MAG: hypothetical protein HY881_21230 [Deltaproteobacteria bacterium]|nr:hypothetical protein [Deltaproteobacteria bacterium]
MSITLDDKAVDVFKLYDEMAIACSKDIEGYQTLIKAIEVMIAQKQNKLQDIKDKTVDLIKNSIASPESTASGETPLLKKDKKFNYAGIDMEALIPGKETGKAVAENTHSTSVKEQPLMQSPPIQAQKPRPASPKKTTGTGKVKRTNKVSTKTNTTKDVKEFCLYHPDTPVSDKSRQLCSSCKWKLITNGLTKYDKEPSVISFLKGESTKIPDLGQSMCPIHPAVPSYNKKTGLCKDCQKKAKAIGVQDRHLTEEELNVLRNPFS